MPIHTNVGVKQRAMESAALATAFAQETKEPAHAEWRAVADHLRERFARLSKLMDEPSTTPSPTWPSPKSIGPSCTRPIRSNGSIARSSGAPTSSPSSQRGRDHRPRRRADARAKRPMGGVPALHDAGNLSRHERRSFRQAQSHRGRLRPSGQLGPPSRSYTTRWDTTFWAPLDTGRRFTTKKSSSQ